MDESEEKPGPSGQSHTQDDCYIVSVSSSSSENSESNVGSKALQKRQIRPVEFKSKSSDQHAPGKKKVKLFEINSDDEILEVISDTEEKPTTNTQKSPEVICIDDNGNNNESEIPKLKRGTSHDCSQIYSDKKEAAKCAVYQHNPPDNVREKQGFSENLSQPPNDPEANLQTVGQNSPTEDLILVLERPQKRRRKTSSTCVTPADNGQKKHASSEKKHSAAKVEKYETGRAACQIPGCFLLDIEKSKEYSGRKFKKNKDELIQKIYTLFNNTIFDQKLPEKIDITWNKKMLRTAGLCTTSERQYPKKERYAKIEISLKVCDSADRLRDTLIHEICHAASWLIDGIRESHGDTWKYYARKSNKVHPELPLVTRCHSYTVNYKIYYECNQCKTRIGRYTRSLNSERCICVVCKGPLVLVPLTRKDGTPIEPYVRPFGKYVQENYRTVLQEMVGCSHGDVMRRLSKDYIASKQKKNP